LSLTKRRERKKGEVDRRIARLSLVEPDQEKREKERRGR
jgi:hypothetical protein